MFTEVALSWCEYGRRCGVIPIRVVVETPSPIKTYFSVNSHAAKKQASVWYCMPTLTHATPPMHCHAGGSTLQRHDFCKARTRQVLAGCWPGWSRPISKTTDVDRFEHCSSLGVNSSSVHERCGQVGDEKTANPDNINIKITSACHLYKGEYY